MNIRLIALLSSLCLLAACETPSGEDGAAGGAGGAGFTADGKPINPGSQEDLSTNVGDRVFFAYDSSALSSEAQSTLQRQVSWLQKYPNLNVVVEGHCDERGTREYNIALGERRASSVKNYLVSLGVPGARVSTVSYGKERPAVLGSDDSSWAQNRRGVTVISY